jgi:hypothetical protein
METLRDYVGNYLKNISPMKLQGPAVVQSTRMLFSIFGNAAAARLNYSRTTVNQSQQYYQ